MKYFSTLICLFLFAYSNAQELAWTLSLDENNFKVYTREIPGTDFKEIKAKTTAKADIRCLIAVLQDVEAYTEWIPYCEEAKILERISETNHLNYTLNDTPFPLDDRDAINRMLYSRDSLTGTVFVNISNHPDYIPKNEDVVRVPISVGTWTFVPKENEMVEITYQLLFDPGGAIPSTLYNMKITEFPHDSVEDLILRSQLPKYNNAEFDFLK